MYNSTELQLLRNADASAQIPGVDTTSGNETQSSSLTPISAITTDPTAPIYYRPSVDTVVVQQAGATLDGYDFGDATVAVNADDVTIENSTFTGTKSWFAVQVWNGHADTTVTSDTFDGGGQLLPLSAWITSSGAVTVTNNRFLDTPSDGVDVTGGGVISGNYFSGAGYTSDGGHPDAIWVTDSTAPLSITDNFIDWTRNADSNVATNNGVRITAEKGSVANVSVSGNFIFGGTFAFDAGNKGTAGTFSNIVIADNYTGFSQYGQFYPGPNTGVTASGDVVLDYANAAYSSAGWAAYQSAGVPTPNLLVSSGGATVTAASESGPTTLRGSPGAVLQGGSQETNFVGGVGSQYMWCAWGANIFTYLSPADSTPDAPDHITNFDPAKDVIDLSNIDASVTPGDSRTFTFIGADAFSGDGGEIRYQQNAASDTTDIEVALAGDATPDMRIVVQGLVTPTAANFALTAAQSSAAMAAGAALAETPSGRWPMNEYSYTGVQGRDYASYSSVTIDSTLVADALDFGGSTGELDLMSVAGASSDSVTVSRGNGRASIAGDAVGQAVDLTWRADETIEAGDAGTPEAFALSAGFGDVTIDGFATSGKNADTLSLSTSAFDYLSPGMSQAQDLSAVLSHASGGANGTAIADSSGDRLTLTGVGADTLAANPGLVRFV